MSLSNATLENTTFADWLDTLSFDPNMMEDINIPEYIHRTSNKSDFLERIYPEQALHAAHDNPDFFIGCAILSTRGPQQWKGRMGPLTDSIPSTKPT
jgi:hypothetical protein